MLEAIEVRCKLHVLAPKPTTSLTTAVFHLIMRRSRVAGHQQKADQDLWLTWFCELVLLSSKFCSSNITLKITYSESHPVFRLLVDVVLRAANQPLPCYNVRPWWDKRVASFPQCHTSTCLSGRKVKTVLTIVRLGNVVWSSCLHSGGAREVEDN